MVYEIKTKVNDSNVDEFLDKIEDEKRREECFKVLDLMKKATKEEPFIYGSSIIGFVKYSYVSKSNCKGDFFKVGFSPKKNYLALYIVPYIKEQEELIKKIGKAKVGKSCINVNSLEDIDLKILEKLVKLSVKAKVSNEV
jgi:hypothetical protein